MSTPSPALGLRHWAAALICCGTLALVAIEAGEAQQPAPAFGGAYSGLGERRQQLIADWITRFEDTTGQTVAPAEFYDEFLSISTKTTFDAVTHALMATPLTGESSARLADDALALIERVESIKGQIPGASSDRQFRLYVRLVPTAMDTLARSREFKRGIDNTVFHKGYPVNFRAAGGAPSIQISIAPDQRRADVDVDYRSSSFPVSLFNGHLSSANSDVRAGDNADRHSNRWAGLQNWWRSFFGVNLGRAPDEKPDPRTLPRVPRAGKKTVEIMTQDFLSAWLVEGNIIAAMGYVSDRAYACLAKDADDPSAVDHGMAPFQLMGNLKAAHDSLGRRASLEGLVTGVRLTAPALRVIQQPHHAQFVLYAVPDDVAAAFDCESRMMPGGSKRPARAYGNYLGSTFYIDGHENHRVALLWAKDNGYWKIVAWTTGTDEDTAPIIADEVKIARVKADPGLVAAAQTFLQAWLIRKDYDAAFRYLSPAAYGCYDLARNPADAASASPEDAARRIRAGLERAGQIVGPAKNLDSILRPADPIHPAVRLMDHRYQRTFTLTSLPNAIGDAAECDARARNATTPIPLPLDYGQAFGLNMRFGPGEGAVLRALWRNEGGTWRIRSYDVELP